MQTGKGGEEWGLTVLWDYNLIPISLKTRNMIHLGLKLQFHLMQDWFSSMNISIFYFGSLEVDFFGFGSWIFKNCFKLISPKFRLNWRTVIFWERVYAGTVPANKEYAEGKVPANKKYASGTVPVNKKYAACTLKKIEVSKHFPLPLKEPLSYHCLAENQGKKFRNETQGPHVFFFTLLVMLGTMNLLALLP